MPEYLTAEELARRLRLSVDTVRRLERTGQIPSVRISPKIVRYDFAAVGAALTARAAQGRKAVRHAR